ncbi:MAG: hypothetical protein ACU0BB_11475 [Paracoccaceae bacterium]
MSAWPSPFTAAGQHVTLVPLSQDHCADLRDSAADGALYRLW